MVLGYLKTFRPPSTFFWARLKGMSWQGVLRPALAGIQSGSATLTPERASQGGIAWEGAAGGRSVSTLQCQGLLHAPSPDRHGVQRDEVVSSPSRYSPGWASTMIQAGCPGPNPLPSPVVGWTE